MTWDRFIAAEIRSVMDGKFRENKTLTFMRNVCMASITVTQGSDVQIGYKAV